MYNYEEDWDNYKILRNQCSAKVTSDRSNHLKKQYEKLNENNDSCGLYNLTKQKMGWKAAKGPECFIKDGNRVMKPKELADMQVEHFHEKVKKLKSELPLRQ